jgi:hypothetical protein
MRAVLRKYFDNPREFVDVLSLTGSVVGGSTVLSVLAPGDWEAQDLDVVVPAVTARTLAKFFLEQGYTVDKDKQKANVHYPNGRTTGTAISFHYVPYRRGDTRIDVCETRHFRPPSFVCTPSFRRSRTRDRRKVDPQLSHSPTFVRMLLGPLSPKRLLASLSSPPHATALHGSYELLRRV